MDTLKISNQYDLRKEFELATRPYSFQHNELLANQQLYESNARTYPRRLPLAIKKASGIYVQDTEGHVFFDCLTGAGALALGHNHPAILDALRSTLDAGAPLLTLDITTPIKDRFVEDLMACLPEAFASNVRIQFCSPSGADAIEAAIKLVKTATGKSGIMAFQGSYHGMTHGALSITSMVSTKGAIPGLMPDVVFLPFPYDYRCPLGLGGDIGEEAILYYIESLLSDPCSGIPPIAGMVVEVIQGEGGVIPASDNWMRGIRRLTEKYNIPLIIDEVQTGIGRTGTMFAFERSGIVPDVIVISKGIGGSLPLSMIVYNEKLDKWTQGAHVGTFRGNQLAMAAGSAVLKTIQQDGLIRNANLVGQYLLSRLADLQAAYSFIGDVRGRGLMVAAEIVNTAGEPDRRGKFPVHYKMAMALQQECFKRGLIIELGGRKDSTIRLLPPLTISLDEANEIMGILEEAFKVCSTMIIK